jgi:hypothetical protein
VTDPLLSYEINSFNIIMDTITNSFEKRYAEHGTLCADFSCLDPKNFQNHSENLQPTVLKRVFEFISPFLSTLTLNDLQVELKDFRSKI